MRRLILAMAVALGAALLAPVASQAAFGFKDASVLFSEKDGAPATQAGSHPFAMTTKIDLNEAAGNADGSLKTLVVELPAGFVGDPNAVPRCSDAEFLTPRENEAGEIVNPSSCPDSTAIGFIASRRAGDLTFGDDAAAYNLTPAPGAPAKIGFRVLGVFVTVEVGVRPGGEPLFSTLADSTQVEPVGGAVLTLWGDPTDPAHDLERGDCVFTAAADSCPVSAGNRPFLTLPRSCSGPLRTLFAADSWETPGLLVDKAVETPPGMTGCAKLGFGPTIDARPTSRAAQSPTGLDFDLDVNDEGLTSKTGLAQSDIEKAVVTLPEGMTANPSLAEGLGVCSEEDLGRETSSSPPGAGCPEASKIGTVEVQTPLLDEAVDGSLYVAKPYENPFHSLLALYMVIKNANLGIVVAQPLEVKPDPTTGQLVTTADDLPQVPLSHVRIHLREGGRSPLISPPRCGSFEAGAEFTPWSGTVPTRTTSAFQIVSGPNEGPCPPGGVAPFQPGFEAGTISNAAGRYSPFDMRLTRRDGEQEMTKFSAVLPQGVVGRIAGIPYCPDAAIAAAKSKSGLQERAAPSCPSDSAIGRTVAGAGVGSQLTYVPGMLYLAGPVDGDPLSVVAITPAVAGPFDAGTVVVREALTLNPKTAEVEVDGSRSDPIPHILQGIPLNLRDLRIYADRPDFTINATSCEPTLARAKLFGSFLKPLDASDDVPVSLSSRYQAAGCAALGFKPKVAITLNGGTKRGAFPALKAIVTPRASDANFASAVVTLPHSAFLEQGHIRTICTRLQFAAGAGHGAACPAASRYGHAKAWTPLLAEPLTGPVFLRSSNHKLPDLVVALHGVVDIELAARIDSIKGGIRSTFTGIPDAPVSRFILAMRGGKRGLIVNSVALCRGVRRAKEKLRGQNGKFEKRRLAVRAASCAKHKKHSMHARRRSTSK